MNERVPDSAGFPLRAIVMVLLFFGVIFLLAAMYALSSDGDADDEGTSVPTITTTTSAPADPEAEGEEGGEGEAVEEPAVEVRVYNVSEVAGAADRTATTLRDAGWNVTEVDNLPPPALPGTTVFFGDAEGEQAAAEEVGRVLEAPVEPRLPELVEQPPGVIVLVTG